MSGPRIRLLLALLLLLLLVTILAWLGTEVASGRTVQFDLQDRDAIHQHASPPLTRAMTIVSFIVGGYVILPLAIVSFICLWPVGLKHEASLLAIAMAGVLPIEP